MMSKAFDKKQRKQAQKQAENTYVLFIKWCKWGTYIMIATVLIASVGCNNGVDGTGSKPNGELCTDTC